MNENMDARDRLCISISNEREDGIERPIWAGATEVHAQIQGWHFLKAV
jgi:hypothetical protein